MCTYAGSGGGGCLRRLVGAELRRGRGLRRTELQSEVGVT